MDKDQIVAEFLKIYFHGHPEKLPEDTDKAFELFKKLHTKYKNQLLSEFKQKSEKYVDRFLNDKDKGYL